MTGSRSAGITHPSIDELLEQEDTNKYSLVIYAAKRARQINAYFTPTEGMLQYVGPLVEAHAQEKSLSIALREIHEGAVRAVRGGAATVEVQQFDSADFEAVDFGSGLEAAEPVAQPVAEAEQAPADPQA